MGNTMMKFFFRMALAAALLAVGAGVQAADMQGMLHDHKDHMGHKKGGPSSCDEAGARAAAAIKEIRPLAANGDAHAQYELGFMYDRGNGVPQDFKEAASWYGKAAEQGNASAQFYLGHMYDLGKGVTQDYKQAAAWYSKAAEQGVTMAQLNLGFLYEHGQGVPVDMVQAYKWYSLASVFTEGSAQDSKKDTEIMAQGVKQGAEAKMTPKEIGDAQALVQEWKAKHK